MSKKDIKEIQEEQTENETPEEMNDSCNTSEEGETVDEVTLLQEQVKQLEDQLLRERAEVENFKRRTKQEYETNMKFANQSLIEQFLPILDGFDRALANDEANDDNTKQFLKGFEMIASLLKQTLENAGLTVISTVGEQFDPYLHQAVTQDTDEEKEDNEILEELQKGYKLKDRVIRASMVKVNKK